MLPILWVWFYIRHLGQDSGESGFIRTCRTCCEVFPVAVGGHRLAQRGLGKGIDRLMRRRREAGELIKVQVVEMEFESGHGIGGSIARKSPGVTAWQ